MILTDDKVFLNLNLNLKFDINHTDVKKNKNTHLLAASVKSHIHSDYPTHMKIYTDGSVLYKTQSGATFIIPSLKVAKSDYSRKT